MRCLLRLLVVALFFCFTASVCAQDKDAPAPQDQKAEKTDKEKAKDKKKKEKIKQQDVLNTEVFSDAVANNVLSELRDGLEGHSRRLVLSVFDDDKMSGYLSFEDQIESFFNRYEAFRVRYRILQTTVEGVRGVALVDFQMEEIPRNAASAPVRKSSQIRFELERGRKGWKIVDFNPRGFFS